MLMWVTVFAFVTVFVTVMVAVVEEALCGLVSSVW